MAIYSHYWQYLAIYVSIYIWQYILAGVGVAMNGGFWQYAALQFYLQAMHTNQVEAGTIKLSFDILSCHLLLPNPAPRV